MNVLFICSRNQWRSRTAEDIFKQGSEHQVKSAGTSPSARIKVSGKLIDWADIIFVMEKKHKQIIQQKYGEVLSEKEIINLNIPDEYIYMDEELIGVLKDSLKEYFD